MESGPTTREILPLDLEQTGCLSEFKVKITKWNPQNCSCRFCKTLAKYCFYLNLASKQKRSDIFEKEVFLSFNNLMFYIILVAFFGLIVSLRFLVDFK